MSFVILKGSLPYLVIVLLNFPPLTVQAKTIYFLLLWKYLFWEYDVPPWNWYIHTPLYWYDRVYFSINLLDFWMIFTFWFCWIMALLRLIYKFFCVDPSIFLFKWNLNGSSITHSSQIDLYYISHIHTSYENI